MVKTVNISGKLHSSLKLHGNTAVTSHNHEICKATSKTSSFFKRNMNEKSVHSIAFGQLYEQEITFRHKDTKQISVFRRRLCGYSVKSEARDVATPVFLKYDEITYPVSTASSDSTESASSYSSKSAYSYSTKSVCTSEPNIHICPKRTTLIWFILILTCFTLCTFLLGRNFSFQKTCNELFDTQTFRDILDENVFGQDEIKEQLITILNTSDSSKDSDLKLIIFSGGSGVGKTYIASLLSKFFPWPENVFKFMAPVHFDIATKIIYKHLSSCGYNLVVIDDLKESDINMALELKRYYKLLYKEKLLKIILIMIFNTGQNFSINNINDFNIVTNLGDLIESEESVHHLKFGVLTETEIMKCIEKSMYCRGVREPLELIDTFFSNFMSNFLLRDGCKRVSSKVSVFLEMNGQKKVSAGHV